MENVLHIEHVEHTQKMKYVYGFGLGVLVLTGFLGMMITVSVGFSPTPLERCITNGTKCVDRSDACYSNRAEAIKACHEAYPEQSQ